MTVNCKKKVAYFCHLTCDPPTVPESPEFTEVLEKFPVIFTEPKDLLPHRTTNHHIELETSAQPVNINPYRYLHF